MKDAWKAQMNALGDLIRTQRHVANLSLRELAAMTSLSNAYLSQLERGLHEPSMRVLKSISDALDISTETLLHQAGLFEDTPDGPPPATEDAIRADPGLTEAQKEALIAVYRSYLAAGR